MGVPVSVSEARARLEAALTYLPSRYSDAVSKAKWKDPTLASSANYYSALQQVIANKTYDAGVRSTDDSVWKNGAINKGAPVIATRIREALPTWETHFGAKYQKVLSVLPTLKAKSSDWRQNIQNRLVPVVAAWKGETVATR
jgi:uncharacterized membrane protein